MAAQKVGRVRACHQMLMCEPGMTNMKVGQDNLLLLGLLGGGTQSFDDGLKLVPQWDCQDSEIVWAI